MDMIRLYIHDKCLERVFNLPKETQKKVLDFQTKFRQNSKSAAVHLEPIHDFKDPQLRTARIDQKYRAIVRVPPTGSDYYLLWVDNHDEAMAWARNKTFVWNEHTAAAQIFDAPMYVEAAPEKEQLVEGLFAPYSDEQLRSIGVPDLLLQVVRSMVSLTDLEAAEAQMPADAFENLFYLADGANIQTLIAEVKEGAANEGTSINNRRHFVVADDKLLEEYLNGDLSKWQVFLHPSQRKLAEGDFKGPVKVTGGGGTGKTVVALHRLKRLTDANPEIPVLFTAYNLALTENLKSLISKMGIRPTSYVLKNIDALAKDLGLRYGLTDQRTKVLNMPGTSTSREVWEKVLEEKLSSFDAAFLDAEYNDVWQYNKIQVQEDYFRVSRIGRGKPITRKQKTEVAALIVDYEQYKSAHFLIDRSEFFNKLTEKMRGEKAKPFSYVIADEVQDMSNVELRFLRSLTDEKENDLFLVGDPYQKIYARKINFGAAGIAVRGNRSKRLRINYRTTEEIKRLAISTVRGFSYDDFDGAAENMDGYLSLFHGDRPTYQLFKTEDEEQQFIVETISTLHATGEDWQTVVVACRLKEKMRLIKSALHRAKLPYFDLTDGTGDDRGIRLSTFHSLKGLEYKTVFLAGLNKQTAPLQVAGYNDWEEAERRTYLQSERSLLYVAMTRAIQNLVLTGGGVKSELINLG